MFSLKCLILTSIVFQSISVFSQETKQIDDQRAGVYIRVIDIVNKKTIDSCSIGFSSEYRDTTFENIYGSKSFILQNDGNYKVTINKSGYSEKFFELDYSYKVGSIHPQIIFHIYPENYSKIKRNRAYRKYKRYLRRKDRKSPKRTCIGMNGIPIVVE
tara:strand:- start:188 stop:661 length:474 start_codon:yes stop_codon:yes gene_type:complete